ncbi:MAG: Transcriptional regulator, MarR family [Pseudomonas sp.]|nr:Transcriptional regulator, MarR family [Pseudomonas sp.]
MKNPKQPPTETDINPGTDELDALGDLVCTNTALRRAARRLGNLYDEALAPLGLKATQIGLLAEISRCTSAADPDGPTLQDLAGRLAILMSALTHAMKPLVRDAIVELRQDTLDKRTKHCVLTPKGKKLLIDALGLWATANNRVEAVLGQASAALLRELADTVSSDGFLADYHAHSA